MSNFLPLAIRHILGQTEWNPHEITVYSTLLEKGAMDLSRIALETNIGTSSVQYALKRLHARHMVTKFLMNSKPRWKAKELDALRRWFKGQTQQFRMNEEAVQHFIDQYDFNPNTCTPTVEFREGMKAVKKSLQGIGERSVSKEMLVIALFDEEMNAELLQFMRQEYAFLRTNTGIEIKMLTATHMRKAMQLSDSAKAVLHIIDDMVYVMHFDKGDPSSVLMEYPQMAAVLRGMFQCLCQDNNCELKNSKKDKSITRASESFLMLAPFSAIQTSCSSVCLHHLIAFICRCHFHFV